jgi:hypothetical protein
MTDNLKVGGGGDAQWQASHGRETFEIGMAVKNMDVAGVPLYQRKHSRKTAQYVTNSRIPGEDNRPLPGAQDDWQQYPDHITQGFQMPPNQ